MNNELSSKKEHLSEEVLEKLKLGVLEDDELILALDHISECKKCAGVFANSFEENELIDVPMGFQEKVESKIKRKEQSNIQFGFYCLKVAAAASFAIIILFSNGLKFLANEEKKYVKSPDLSFVSSINDNLSTFSKKLINLEDFNNDKEKE